MYPQGVCRIRKPAYAGNGCAIFPVFDTEEWAKKIRSQPQTIYSEVPLFKWPPRYQPAACLMKRVVRVQKMNA